MSVIISKRKKCDRSAQFHYNAGPFYYTSERARSHAPTPRPRLVVLTVARRFVINSVKNKFVFKNKVKKKHHW